MTLYELNIDKLKVALSDIEHNTFQSLCKKELENIVVDKIYELKLTEINKRIFESGYNKNAIYVNLSGLKHQYIKISLDLNVYSNEDLYDSFPFGEVFSLNQRSSMNRSSIEVFFKHRKLCDDEVLISIYTSGIDLYLPIDSLGDTNEGLLTIKVKEFSTIRPYKYYHKELVNETELDNPFPDEDISYAKVYNKGLLLTLDEDYYFKDNKLFFKKIFHNCLEIILDNNIISKTFIVKSEDNLIVFDNDFLENLPINVDNMEIYISGRMVNYELIKNKTSRIFYIDGVNQYYHLTIFFHYRDIENIRKNYVYKDDYNEFFSRVYKSWIKDIVNENYTEEMNKVLPEYVKDIEFPPEYIKTYDVDYSKTHSTYKEWLYYILKKYCKINNFNKYFILRQFADIRDEVFIYNSSEDRVRTDTTIELGEYNIYNFPKEMIMYGMKIDLNDYEILTFVNDIKISTDNFKFFKYLEKCYIYINKEILSENDVIRFKILPIRNRSQIYKKIKLIPDNFTIEIPASELKLEMSQYGEKFDIIVMKENTIEQTFTYLKVDKDYSIKLEDGIYKLHIPFKLKDNEILYVYNSSFYDLANFTVEDEEDRIFYLDKKDSKDKYTLSGYTNYYYYVFKNDKLIIPQFDYRVSPQRFYSSLKNAKLNLTSPPKANDRIEIYTIEQPKRNVQVVPKVNSEYGLIYFDNLPFPFSLEYLNLYINGKYVMEDDIDQISSKCIRIKNSKFYPLKSIYLESNLTFPITYFEDYFDISIGEEKDTSKWDDYIARTNGPSGDKVQPGTNYPNGENKDPVIDNLFEDKPDKIKTDDSTTSNGPIREALLEEIIGEDLRTGILPRYLDASRFLIIDDEKYLEYMDILQIYRNAILLDANKDTLLNDSVVDVPGTLREASEITELVGMALDNGTIELEVDDRGIVVYKDFFTNPLSKKVYLTETALVSTKEVINDVIILDANL